MDGIRRALYVLLGLMLIATGIAPFIKMTAYSDLYAVEYENGDGYAWAQGYSAPIFLPAGSYQLLVTGSTTALESNTGFVASLVSDETLETAAAVSGLFYLKEVPLKISDSEYFSRMELPENCTATMINHQASVSFYIPAPGSYSIKYEGVRAQGVLKTENIRFELRRRLDWPFIAIPGGLAAALAVLLWGFERRRNLTDANIE